MACKKKYGPFRKILRNVSHYLLQVSVTCKSRKIQDLHPRCTSCKLAERVERGNVINPLDEACRQHNPAYTDSNSDRRQADRVLAQYAFSRMLAKETSFDERTVAMMTACCMVSKVTFQKKISRIKNVMRKRDKKDKNQSVAK